MHMHCALCGYKYERAPGYFLGSIYINYGATALLVTAGYFSLWSTDRFDPQHLLWIAAAFILLFPMLFFRWARAVWMAFDQWFDPASEKEMQGPGDP